MGSAGRRGIKPRAQSHDGVRQASHLRALNLERVLNSVISRETPFTRTELITDTGLSPPTVSGLAHHLLRVGLLKDLGTGPSRGGRRPSFMEFNARHGYVAGIDLGPLRTRLAVADLRGDLLVERVVETPALRDPKALLAYVATEMRSLLQEADVPASKLLAVGAGAPGAVDQVRGVVLALVPDLKGWSNVPMAAILRAALGAPVVIDNDVNLAVMGEHWRGAARDHTTCVFITVGTGIGAGILVKGELHHGHHFFAGEIALMCMGPQYVEADFGARGCLETLVGLKALGARWPHPPELNGDSWVRALFDAARHGDRRAALAAEEASTLIGMAAANLSVVLDPSLIVLGGALIAQVPTFVDDVRRVVARIVPTPCEIVESQLGEEATLWGSVLAATTVAQERLRQKLRRERPTG
jgi:glucokinase